ncbi:hypothetical protein EA658_14405 [Pseudoxanthomonas winnipegensis]|uniref:Uncharacterized protein n=1 Tax=Pseudoxanthomonas winnipegensis TaxID=2480810 RepID=A0ABY1WBD5_9GAMM|nr:DUF6216 family protein [Pseudoxanthomonas winnipegensis]TAA10886.1 hypothetical protein EA659_05815 [Pseudoxanthomonas winnipegensis]TAA18312.1 hypothetical protein EA658_14405 [Pseudoxanthomonas winnipegensis]TAH74313.1 hypothetical protein EA657_02345 [Pseudoxanthomonas winnipegensis]
MDWLEFLTREIAPYSVIGILAAAVITCWKAESFHPINARLLRFFISREEVEDSVIKKSLTDQSALISFRMTHGVRAQTLKDAKKLVDFAEYKNIPLDLIGRAGWAFDLKKLVIKPRRVPHKALLALPAIGLFLLVWSSLFFAAAATKSDLLVTIKNTDTYVWLSKEEARAALPFQGEPGTISPSECTPNGKDLVTPAGFDSRDRAILCDIWKDPALDPHLAKEVPKQRKIFLAAFAMLAWWALMALGLLREWLAQIELDKALKEDAEESEIEPVQ